MFMVFYTKVILFGDFEEDYAPKVAMGKDGIMTITSK
jgi:hypothetical protein